MNIVSFLFYCIIVTFTPGPSNILIMSTVQNSGTKKALEFVYGASIAFAILVMTSTALNTFLKPIIPSIVDVMRVVGSVYILYLAWKIFKMEIGESTQSETGGFSSGFIMQFVNPKVILFTMTVIPGFVMPYYTDIYPLLMFALCITVIGCSAFATWVVFGVVLKKFFQKYQKTMNTVMALFLVYSAVTISGILN